MEGDLSVTALYTSQVWSWGGLACAELFATTEAKRVYDVTNAALAAASMFKRGGSPLRYALLHRHTMIDHLLRASGVRRVVELAAGLSRRGAAVSADAGVDYTEIDLPRVIARKRELLERTTEGRAVLARPGLHLIDGDLETVALEPFVAAGEPVFVIAEGLLMYLAAEARRSLFAKVRALAERAGELRFVFDLVPQSEEPAPGAVGRALEAAMKRFTGGRTFERDARTREAVLGELRGAGFSDCEAIGAGSVARAWQLPHPDQQTNTVVFTSRAGSRSTRS
ncbi:MAG: hypothetical protein JWO36_6551 [Myxococcales bacterium]|nr:hypothetical protein [Myxococcales bacterium]